jgi:glutamate synthase domain-containing protein 1
MQHSILTRSTSKWECFYVIRNPALRGRNCLLKVQPRRAAVVYFPNTLQMCGIAGFFHKTDTRAPVGCGVMSMLSALECRGPDSTGVALFGSGATVSTGPVHAPASLILRVKLGEGTDLDGRAQTLRVFLERFGGARDLKITGSLARFVLEDGGNLDRLVAGIEALDEEFEVVSAGRMLEIVKQVGSPENLERTYRISQACGSHAIGHTRLSTESRVDLSHSQPFWAHAVPDLAVVHNGHITNYHQLRRRLEQKGVRFYTENDSEIIGIYIARQLERGLTLEQALRAMLDDLDGSYSTVVATASEFGFVKDPFALKPLLFAETPAAVAIANEEIAIRAAIPGDYDVREAQAKDVRVWRK